jgi:flagellar motor switch protein FliN/FliY
MDNKKLSSMEIDAIGEILNISLGASATAISTMLDARVNITTPVVRVQTEDEFKFNHLEPAIGVEIVYIEGLTGSNIMLLKRNDVRTIVEMLMGMEIPEEEFELNEMNISAICEVMNLMMGASATALSELLGRTVNISTPESFEIGSAEQFKDKYFNEEGAMTSVGFTIQIGDKMKSEFMNLMPIGLAHELVAGFFSDGVPDIVEEPEADTVESAPIQNNVTNESAKSEDPEIEIQDEQTKPEGGEAKMQEEKSNEQHLYTSVQNESIPPTSVPNQVQAGEPGISYVQNQTSTVQPQNIPVQTAGSTLQAPAGDTQGFAAIAGMMDLMRQQMEAQQQQMQQMQQMQLQQMQQMQTHLPKKIGVNPAPRPNLSNGGIIQAGQEEHDTNMELIMGVPLDISVEIGRTKKLVRDILDLNKGSLVVLDKLAGEQVDLFVNGQCIAKGDVVVVDDNFGIRITEILKDEIALLE